MKTKLLVKSLLAALALVALPSCTVTFLPAVPTGGGGGAYCAPQGGGRPMPRIIPGGGQSCGLQGQMIGSQNGGRIIVGRDGRPIDPRLAQYPLNRGNGMPLGWTNNHPGQNSNFPPGGMPFAGQGRYDARLMTQGGRGFNPDNPNIGYEGGAIDPRTGRPFRRNVGNFGSPGDASVLRQ